MIPYWQSASDDAVAHVATNLRTSLRTGVEYTDALLARSMGTGKLLRPRLVIETALACGGTPHERVTSSAAAVELLHAASLIHDDLIDDAPSRRGIPSLHISAGIPRSILVGDFIIASAFSRAAEGGVDVVRECTRAFAKLNRGQLAEFELDTTAGEPAFRQYIALKTAALFEVSTRIGAHCAGASPAVIEHLGQFGWHFGMLFQMVDDLIDIVSTEVAAGKPVQQDLRNGVHTIAALHHEALFPGTIMELIAAGQFDEAYTKLRSPRIMEYATAAAAAHATEAIAHLDASGLGSATDGLRAFTATFLDEALTT